MINQKFYKKKESNISLKDIVSSLNIDLTLSNDINISGVNNLCDAQIDEISFVTNKKYLTDLKLTKAKYILVEKNFENELEEYKDDFIFLISNNAYNDLGKILTLFYTDISSERTIAKSAIISPNAIIGKNCFIGDGVIIADGVIIGDNTKILAGTHLAKAVEIGCNSSIGTNNSISFTKIGDNVEIEHNNSIGQNGFGFSLNKDHFKRMLQLGLVIIEDYVSIGSNNSIDRGGLSNTIVGLGTKIDNLVHIAHNVKIGKHCLITAQNGIAGSAEIGDYCVFGGQCGVAGHIKIGSYNRFSAQAGITKNISDNGGDFYGMPAIPKKEWQQEKIAIRNLIKKK